MRFRDGVPEAPLAEVGPAPAWPGVDREGRPPAPRSPSCRAPRPSRKTEFDFTTLEHRLRELAFLNSGVTLVLSDLRGVEPKTVTLHFEGGLEAFVALSRPLEAGAACAADRDPRRARRHHRSKSRWSGPTAITRRCSALPTTSRSATAARISPAFARR